MHHQGLLSAYNASVFLKLCAVVVFALTGFFRHPTCPDDMNVARSPKEVCISDVGSWMACNKLKLNSIATELLVLNAPHRPQPPLERLLVCGDRSLRYLKPAILVSLFLSQKSRDTN